MSSTDLGGTASSLSLVALESKAKAQSIRKLAGALGRGVLPNREFSSWRKSRFSMPAPASVKWGVLHRWGKPDGTWIETGTYKAHTTEFLAVNAEHVFSIEPDPEMADRARKRFQHLDNVTIIRGLSEDHIDEVLDSASGPISLWLDGHFSGAGTHQGPIDTPIAQELEAVRLRLHKFEQISIMVDDVRLFDPKNPEFSSYPTRSWLVKWADDCDMEWHIEHDIFIALKHP